jgi:YidC/Oxa1 family membrane protein insertase
MDRKGIIAVVLAIGVLLWWTNQQSKEVAKHQEQQRLQQEAEAKKNATPAPVGMGSTSSSAVPLEASQAGTLPPGAPAYPEKIEEAKTPEVVYRFTNLGGGIQSVALPEHKANDATVELNKFSTSPIGAISEAVPGGPGANTNAPYDLTPNTPPGEVTYERTDARKLQITKKFKLPQTGSTQDGYTAVMELTFTNKGDQPIALPAYYVHTGAVGPMHQTDLYSYTVFGWMSGGKFTSKDSGSFKAGGVGPFGKSDAPTFTADAQKTTWAAVSNQYFASLVTLSGVEGAGVWAHRYAVPFNQIPAAGLQPKNSDAAATADKTVDAVEGAIQLPGLTLAPGATITHAFQVYTGPREYDRLQKLGGEQQLMMDFGIFKVVSITLLKSLKTLKGWLGSYAVAIIVLTIVIRSLMWPLQNKATQSMKNIAALQPKMNELKEKYPDDPTRQQQEVMKLYKDYGVNPLSGCLPMVIQIPIFIGFYNMLGRAVELRNQPFLGWVHDLSQPDTVGHLFGSPSLPINILPLMMAVTMFISMRLQPKSGDAVQQKVMMFMPMIFVLFCYKYASALALYWTVQNIFSIVQSYVTRNRLTANLQKVPAPAKRR